MRIFRGRKAPIKVERFFMEDVSVRERERERERERRKNYTSLGVILNFTRMEHFRRIRYLTVSTMCNQIGRFCMFFSYGDKCYDKSSPKILQFFGLGSLKKSLFGQLLYQYLVTE